MQNFVSEAKELLEQQQVRLQSSQVEKGDCRGVDCIYACVCMYVTCYAVNNCMYVCVLL
jgi:hypothetical protein